MTLNHGAENFGHSTSSSTLHPRNVHNAGYNFERLVQINPSLMSYIKQNPIGEKTIDFANPKAVKALNHALLTAYYGVKYWALPKGYLCPPVPSRVDYLHYMADLLAASRTDKVIPNGSTVRVLDIGTGANLIYPLVGQHAYSWQFVGADIDQTAIKHAQGLILDNALTDRIALRLQTNASAIFKGIIQPQERFTLTICNPPFHASLDEASKGTARKWRGVGKAQKPEVLNFGGQGAELYCEGGESAFLQRMVKESQLFQQQCLWFSTLVSKASNLPKLYQALAQAQAAEITTIDMQHGQKQTRVVAWSYMTKSQHPSWWT